MPTKYNDYGYYNYYIHNIHTWNEPSFITSSTPMLAGGLLSDYIFNYSYYTPWFDIEYKPKKRKLDLE